MRCLRLWGLNLKREAHRHDVEAKAQLRADVRGHLASQALAHEEETVALKAQMIRGLHTVGLDLLRRILIRAIQQEVLRCLNTWSRRTVEHYYTLMGLEEGAKATAEVEDFVPRFAEPKSLTPIMTWEASYETIMEKQRQAHATEGSALRRLQL